MAVSFAQIRATSDQVFTENCPTRVVLDHVMSKWGVLVLMALTDGTARWGELRRSVTGISEKMLASTLRTLESDGIVNRTAYPEVPPRVEYSLTERGDELMERMMPLMEWIAAHADEIVDRGE
ncbi:helix-turn-helix domain-containing protein [Microbacterium sp. NE2HP2]|uniref:Winged helix-turn-helix transcriptional regulator n=1 Tax=Microbacterium plantarum TaxID=1816425 RepID=A0ABV5ERC6_9MICO|nr:helix-turn-helix domain-containing protein [Microbacterium plantarum]MDD7943100.1 helix-turn-helix domain-containing protein [Microbacterium plantarum]WRK18266.1 helix-turn-helix domain-containing protein [Microbacterium plantarum]